MAEIFHPELDYGYEGRGWVRVDEAGFHHKDPLDRLMIAQALAELMPVVTKDEAFERYTVSLLW